MAPVSCSHHRGRRDPIIFTGDEQKRRAIVVVEVYPGTGARTQLDVNSARRRHNETVVGGIPIPRSASRSSTFLRDSGYLIHIITVSRMISGDELRR